jgi:hypothetical protein
MRAQATGVSLTEAAGLVTMLKEPSPLSAGVTRPCTDALEAVGLRE